MQTLFARVYPEKQAEHRPVDVETVAHPAGTATQLLFTNVFPLRQVVQVVPSVQVAQVDMQGVHTPLAPYCPVGQLVQKERSLVLQVGQPLKQAVQFVELASWTYP